MKHKLYYLGRPGDGYGWGVANTNLIRALGELCEVVCAPGSTKRFDAPVFAPIGYRDLRPDTKWQAPKVLGYCFTEWPLPEGTKQNARAYDLIFCGSTWNAQRLQEIGIKNVDVLLQGIDQTIFKPQPPSKRNGFVVFSGGKYEFRKSQDYVIAAMQMFMAVHPDAVLLASWENQWKDSIYTMRHSWLINFDEPLSGMPDDRRVVLLPPTPNNKMPEIYSQAHVGLFPNRCEAGTNLVMSEFMACGRPVIASYAHGHKDVLPSDYRLLLKTGQYDPAGWFNPEVSDILAHLEWAYKNRTELEKLGHQCYRMTQKLTWQACAAKIYRAAFEEEPPLVADPGSALPALASE